MLALNEPAFNDIVDPHPQLGQSVRNENLAASELYNTKKTRYTGGGQGGRTYICLTMVDRVRIYSFYEEDN
jgi:hypothetical protein